MSRRSKLLSNQDIPLFSDQRQRFEQFKNKPQYIGREYQGFGNEVTPFPEPQEYREATPGVDDNESNESYFPG